MFDSCGLIQAVGSGNTQVVDCLLENGVDINAHCASPELNLLHRAARPEMVLHLLKRGADPSKVDMPGAWKR